MLFFQMSAQVYYVPSQTEGRKKNLLEWKGIDLSSKLSLTCGGNVNYYKIVHDLRQEKVYTFVKFKIILPPSFFIRSPYKQAL